MKSFNKFTFLLVSLFISVTECEPALSSVCSYSINVSYTGGSELRAKAKLTISKNSFDKKIFFLADTTAVFSSIQISGARGSFEIPFQRNQDTLNLEIPSSYTNTKQIHIVFNYIINFDSLYNGVKLISYWYPYLFNNIATYEIITYAPKDYLFLIPGILSKKRDFPDGTECFWKTAKPVPRLFLVLAETKAYTLSKEKLNNINFAFYFLNKDSDLFPRFKKESLEAFKFYQTYIGAYRYKSLTFVEVPAMSYINSQPGLVVIGDLMLDTYYRKNLYDWPPHEIAHQWFGSGIFSKHGDLNSWCIFEPLAEYLRLTFTARSEGEQFIEKEINKMLDEYKADYLGTEDDKPLIESGASRVTYIKGTYVMNRLAEICGKKNWKKFLRKLYSRFEGKFFTYPDFVKYLYKVNKDAAINSKELFETSGLPMRAK